MEWLWGTLAVVAGGGVILALSWRRLCRFGRDVQLEKARELFKLQRERLEAKFLTAAAQTGKPRGLRWKDAHWEPAVEFVRERQTGQIAALVGVAIQFEAIEGGDMEDVKAVADLKNATAVFHFQKNQWLTSGEVHFNVNPDEAVLRKKELYERIER